MWFCAYTCLCLCLRCTLVVHCAALGECAQVTCGKSRATKPVCCAASALYAAAGCMESTAAGTWATEGGR